MLANFISSPKVRDKNKIGMKLTRFIAFQFPKDDDNYRQKSFGVKHFY